MFLAHDLVVKLAIENVSSEGLPVIIIIGSWRHKLNRNTRTRTDWMPCASVSLAIYN